MEVRNNYSIADCIMIALAIIFLGWILTGCTTEKKAVRYMNAHGFQAAEYCAAAFPVKDSTVYLPGQTTVIHHTDTVPGEVIPCPAQKPGEPTAAVHCPPSTNTVDTITRVDTLRIKTENTAKIAALTGQLAVITSRAANAENGRGNWRRWCLITWGILALGGGVFVAAKFKII
jgi:hypothetical protein